MVNEGGFIRDPGFGSKVLEVGDEFLNVVLFRMDSLQTDRSHPYYIITIDIFCSNADLHLSLGLCPVLR